ncbi:hypothetical protein HPB52_021943 [Rhipicephalus sanguineus]|uniref:Reverse transcriptase domain-containing protein n=1 Tax=Rhipicephalus sanguineus TaxID=34632 RepID=A0A9D4Q7T3_RHISA|nr:hypothetical protein HPB52_021943 [Rhipicephalus sanguineus]
MFIEIITKWWKVVNVKTPSKGARLRDEFQEPVFSVEDRKIDFLYNFLDWMEEWKKRTKDCDSGTLTKETHAGLHQTTQGLIEIVRYCLDELKLSYVLLGKIQTDCLEDRSVSEEDEEWQDLDGEANCLRPKCNVVVTEETLTKMKDIIPVLVYVAGYAVYAALKKLKFRSLHGGEQPPPPLRDITAAAFWPYSLEVARGKREQGLLGAGRVRPTDVSSGVSGVSFDVKDLYYSMPQDMLMKVVDEAIDNHGAVRFQNECGMSVEGFLELLRTYLLPSIVEFEGSLYRQKQGICIGCCLAPATLDGLTLTMELPTQQRLRFLDLELTFGREHVCWAYSPRSKKALLPFTSGHSKLVKRGIAAAHAQTKQARQNARGTRVFAATDIDLETARAWKRLEPNCGMAVTSSGLTDG